MKKDTISGAILWAQINGGGGGGGGKEEEPASLHGSFDKFFSLVKNVITVV